jgi:hypothetical protein
MEFKAVTPSGKELANSVRRGLPYWTLAGDKSDPLSSEIVGMQEKAVREFRVTYPKEGVPGIIPGNLEVHVTVRILKIEPRRVLVKRKTGHARKARLVAGNDRRLQ